MSDAVVAVHFKDMSVDDELRSEVERRCAELAAEFPELTHVDVTFTPDGVGLHASAHATGKRTQVASRARAKTASYAADGVIDRLRYQLRRVHEKHIFTQRRRARHREQVA